MSKGGGGGLGQTSVLGNRKCLGLDKCLGGIIVLGRPENVKCIGLGENCIRGTSVTGGTSALGVQASRGDKCIRGTSVSKGQVY